MYVFSCVVFVLWFHAGCCGETICLRSFLLYLCILYSQFTYSRWKSHRKPTAQGRQLGGCRIPAALIKLRTVITVALQSGLPQAGCSNRTVRPLARISLAASKACCSLKRCSRYSYRRCKQYREFIYDPGRHRPIVQRNPVRGRQMLSAMSVRGLILNVVLQLGSATGPLVPMRSEGGSPTREVVKGRHPESDAAHARCARAQARISLTTPRRRPSPSRCGYGQPQQYPVVANELQGRQHERGDELDHALVDLYSANLADLPGSRDTGGTHRSRQRRVNWLNYWKINFAEGAVQPDRTYWNEYHSANLTICDLYWKEPPYPSSKFQRRKERSSDRQRQCTKIMHAGGIVNWKWVEVRRIGEADNPGPPKRPRQRDIPTVDRAMEGLMGHTENRRQQQQQQQRQRRSEMPPKGARQTTRELRRETSATGVEYGREMEFFSSWWTQRDQNQDNGDDEDTVVQATQSTGEGAGAVCGAASSSTVAAPATSSRRKRNYDTQTHEVERSPTPAATQSKSKAQPKPKRSRHRPQLSPVSSAQIETQPPPPPASPGGRQMSLSPLRRTRGRWRHAVEPEGGIPTPPAPQSPAHTL